MAIKTKPRGTKTENAIAVVFIVFEYLLFTPTDWKDDAKPCIKCNDKNTNEIE